MGTIIHDAVLVVIDSDSAPDVSAFRDSLPEEFRPLVVGPVAGVANGTVSFAFLPDGSKEGWPDSDDGDRYRAQFLELFSAAFVSDVVSLRFGGSCYHDEGSTPDAKYPLD